MTDTASRETAADDVLFMNLAKGHKRGDQCPAYSWDWFVSRRARLVISEKELVFGDWVIPVSKIQNATLFRGRQVFMKFLILEVRTAEATYQFGVRQKSGLADKIPFEVECRKVRLRYSRFSIVFRFVLIGATVFCYWMFFGSF